MQTSQTKTMMANQANTPGFAFSEALDGDHGPEPSAPAHADAGDARRVEPRQVDGVLQGPLRRRERLHVRLRRQHRSGRDEAAGRALPRQPAVDRPQGNVEGRRRRARRPASSPSGWRRASSRRASRAIVFTGPFEYNQEQRIAIRAMADDSPDAAARDPSRGPRRHLQRLRQSPSYATHPDPDLHDLDRLRLPTRSGSTISIARVYQEIEKFKTEGPTEKQVTDEREALLRDFETSSKQNGYLLGQLIGQVPEQRGSGRASGRCPSSTRRSTPR